MIKGFVAGGLGVSILPELAGGHPNIELRPVRGAKPVRRVWAVTRETEARPPAAEEMLGILREVCREYRDGNAAARGRLAARRHCTIPCRTSAARFSARPPRGAYETVRYGSGLDRAESLSTRERGTQRRHHIGRPGRIAGDAAPA